MARRGPLAPHRGLCLDPPDSAELEGGQAALRSAPRATAREGAAGARDCPPGHQSAWSLEHPGKHGNATDLAGRSLDEWCGALNQALSLIEVGLPTLYAELTHTLRRVVPVGYHDQRHLSASYTEAPGLIYMTLHPDPLTLAEAIVHETQHGKLNALLWQDAVLINGRSEWTTSPVRDDLRPLMGVLLAAHAFVPVARLHRGLADAGHPIAETGPFQTRREAVLATNQACAFRLGNGPRWGARSRMRTVVLPRPPVEAQRTRPGPRARLPKCRPETHISAMLSGPCLPCPYRWSRAPSERPSPRPCCNARQRPSPPAVSRRSWTCCMGVRCSTMRARCSNT
ncbi:MAG: hypothetical protein IPI43_30140 [Sandaracinaceae bacterium]|nr:hypothetical protein [Sandaracinaceae bacterium]